MKKYNFAAIIALFAIVLFVACSSEERPSVLPPELVEAETIMYEYPDSALHILQEMEMPGASQKLEHATWALLMTQARYKMYIAQNDSLVNIAYNYFMKQEDAQRKALTLYLKGGICNENKEVEEAQDLLLEATEYEKKNNDYLLCHLINAELGCIYVFRSYNEYALDAFHKAYQYALQAKRPKYIISSEIWLGRTYAELKQYNTAIEFYQKAIQNAQEINNVKSLVTVFNELAGIHINMEDYPKALYYARQAINYNSIGTIKGQINLVIGEIYSQLGQIDSAYYYLNQAASFKASTFTVNEAYHSLYNLSKKEQRYKDAIFYGDKYLSGLDSIYNSHKSQELAEMQEKYNQQKVINEKNQLQIEKDSNTRHTLIVLVLLICLIAVLVYIYQRKLRAKERIIQKKEEAIRRSMMQVSKNEIVIKYNHSRMQELSMQIEMNKGIQEQLNELNRVYAELQQQNEDLICENQTLQKNIVQYSSTLDARSEELKKLHELTEENQRLHDRERVLSKQLVQHTKELKNLTTKPQYIEEIQWREIVEAIDGIFDRFTERLSKKYPTLTEYDLHLCCLIKLNISNADIGILLGISPTSVSKQKYRLKERIVQQGAVLQRNQLLDLWVWDF